METTYRLEFSEKQQLFHLDNRTHKENTNGWITICEHCTDSEFEIFQAYLEIKSAEVKTNDFIKSEFRRLKYFWERLLECGYSIQKATAPSF